MVYQNPKWLAKALQNGSRFRKIVEEFYRRTKNIPEHPLYISVEFDKKECLTRVQFYDNEFYSRGLQPLEDKKGIKGHGQGAFWVTSDPRTPQRVIIDLSACIKECRLNGFNVSLDSKV